MNRLQDEGQRLIELNHPASETIQVPKSVFKELTRILKSNVLYIKCRFLLYFKAHIETVRNEWQRFLNLCICQEMHLDIVDEFRKVGIDRLLFT